MFVNFPRAWRLFKPEFGPQWLTLLNSLKEREYENPAYNQHCQARFFQASVVYATKSTRD
jgi:hypothetical protein